MNTPPSDQGIPILTEVIGPQAASEPAIPESPAIPSIEASPESMTAMAVWPAAASPFPATSKPVPAPPVAPAPSRPAFSMPASPSPSAAAAPEIRRAAPLPGPTPAAPTVGATETPAPSPWKDSELGDLEKDLRERITRQVLGRIDFVLDHRVRNTLTDVVESAIDSLAAEIKRGLHETLTDIVARAVAQEISRLQTTKK